jgi:membrane protease YdiL (CAAX protease family)
MENVLFPTKNEKFRNYYAPAVKTNAPWRLLVGLIVLALVYAGLVFLFGLIITFSMGIEDDPKILGKILKGTDPKGVILLLATFVALFLAVIVAVKLVHKRGLRSLLGPNLSEFMKSFRVAFSVVFLLIVISLPVLIYLHPPVSNLTFSTWSSWMILGAPLLLIQVTSEELVFRGYMQQQLAAQFDSRWIWYVLPSLLFGFLHYDAETMGSNAWIVVAHTVLFGLIAADVTARTGNLGAAIGLHFANNLFALTIISLDGSLSGLGLYKTAFHVSDEMAIRSVLIPDILFLTLVYGLFLYWCRNKPQL